MAFKEITESEVYDLRDALEGVQDAEGESDFVAGALAVCEWLTSHRKGTVDDFLRTNDMVRGQ